jgi:hypothetical protein
LLCGRLPNGWLPEPLTGGDAAACCSARSRRHAARFEVVGGSVGLEPGGPLSCGDSSRPLLERKDVHPVSVLRLSSCGGDSKKDGKTYARFQACVKGAGGLTTVVETRATD